MWKTKKLTTSGSTHDAMFILPVLIIKILTKSGECQQYCPATCGENEMVCSSHDPTTSCPHPDSCMPATYEGKFM